MYIFVSVCVWPGHGGHAINTWGSQGDGCCHPHRFKDPLCSSSLPDTFGQTRRCPCHCSYKMPHIDSSLPKESAILEFFANNKVWISFSTLLEITFEISWLASCDPASQALGWILIWEPTILPCYEQDFWGELYRTWAGYQKYQRAELCIFSCFITEISVDAAFRRWF